MFVLAEIQGSVDKVLIFEDKLFLKGLGILVPSPKTSLDVEPLVNTTCRPKYRLHDDKMTL